MVIGKRPCGAWRRRWRAAAEPMPQNFLVPFCLMIINLPVNWRVHNLRLIFRGFF